MSLVHDFKQTVKKALPEGFNPMPKIRRYNPLPTRLDMGPPVIQIYIADGETDTYLGINNFYSVLLPELQTQARLFLQFFRADGRPLVHKEIDLAHFGSKCVSVSQIFKQQGIQSEFGMVTVHLIPRSPRKITYRQLERVASHFFQFFLDKNGSISQIHPSTHLESNTNPTDEAYWSVQAIQPEGLEKIVLYQCNPTTKDQRLTHHLVDMSSKREYARRELNIPAHGVFRVEFEMESIASSLDNQSLSTMQFYAKPLPAPNAKPMLKRVFKSGLYSMSHS